MTEVNKEKFSKERDFKKNLKIYHTGHDFAESVLYIKRVSKVVTGGRVFSCTAYVAVGNGECSIGVGLGKASEVSEAIRKASRKAAKNMIYIPNRKNITVTNDISVKYNATILNLKSAKAGTGLLCCDVAKKIFELANLKDVVLKIHGSSNKRNVICGMIKLFKNLESIRRISQRTGKTIEYLIERRKELKNATSR